MQYGINFFFFSMHKPEHIPHCIGVLPGSIGIFSAQIELISTVYVLYLLIVDTDVDANGGVLEAKVGHDECLLTKAIDAGQIGTSCFALTLCRGMIHRHTALHQVAI